MINDLLQGLVAQLKAVLGNGVNVELFPDDPEGAPRLLTGNQGAALVRYAAGKHFNPEEFNNAPNMADFPLQREYRVQVFAVARGLNGAEGAIALLEQILEALSGFAPQGFGPLLPQQDGFVERRDNLWVYLAQFTVTD